MTLLDLYVYVRDGGTLAVLLLIIVGGMRGWYVWKWYADEQRTRISKLEGQLDRALRAAESGTGLTKQVLREANHRRAEGSDEQSQ